MSHCFSFYCIQGNGKKLYFHGGFKAIGHYRLLKFLKLLRVLKILKEVIPLVNTKVHKVLRYKWFSGFSNVPMDAGVIISFDAPKNL